MSIRERAFRRLVPHFGQPRGVLGLLAGRIMLARNADANRWMIEVADPSPGDRLLDAGCGPGLALDAALERLTSGRATGIDASDVMIRTARRRHRRAIREGRAELLRADVTELPFPTASFDVVVSLNSVGHWGDRAAGLAELHRVCAPGGRLVVVTRTRRADVPAMHPARNGPTPEQIEVLAAEVAAAGFVPGERRGAEVRDDRLLALGFERRADDRASAPLRQPVAPFPGSRT